MHDDLVGLKGCSSDQPETGAHALEMSELVAKFDWAATPLGPAAAWPDSLKAVVRIVLTSGLVRVMAGSHPSATPRGPKGLSYCPARL